MELLVDNDRFGQVQPWFVFQLVGRIKLQLENAGLAGEQLRDATGNVATGVCKEIDGTAGFEIDEIEYTPYLSFSTNQDFTFYSGGASFLEDYVSSVLDELFEPEDDLDEP